MIKKMGLILIISLFLIGCDMKDNNDLVFTGTVEGREVDICSEIGGKIKDVFIEEGDRIEEGQHIAVIDTRDLELTLNKAQEALSLSKAKLDNTIKGAREEEINNLKAKLDKIDALIEGANKNYNYRENNYNNIKELYESGAASEQMVKDAKSLLDAEKTNIDSLKREYDAVKAQLNLLLEGATLETIQMLEAEVNMAESEVKIIENQIEKGKIISNADGIVQNINYERGELISLGGKIATIIDDSQLFVNIYIPEKYLYLIELNKKVKLTNEYLKDLEGEIVYISSEAEFTPKNVESKENKQEMVFRVKIKILTEDDRIKPGMLVDVVLDGEDNE